MAQFETLTVGKLTFAELAGETAGVSNKHAVIANPTALTTANFGALTTAQMVGLTTADIGTLNANFLKVTSILDTLKLAGLVATA